MYGALQDTPIDPDMLLLGRFKKWSDEQPEGHFASSPTREMFEHFLSLHFPTEVENRDGLWGRYIFFEMEDLIFPS